MDFLTLSTFMGATAAVAIATFLIVRRMEKSKSAEVEYFGGGRALTWPIVAGSLMLTNLSTEQLVGLNGAVFGDGNLVGIAWEALAAVAMILTALVFLPRYLRSGFTTTPGYLEQRFDGTTRSIVSGLFLFGYVTVLLPVVLYTGSLAVRGIFDLEVPLWMIVAGIGSLGSCYAIFGGLKSVAVSDTFNGVGLLIGGLAIPFLGLSMLGDGSVAAGISQLMVEKPGSLTPLATLNQYGEPASVPWPTLLTGMMMIQVFYWSTNQVIVQRAIGAVNLEEGQKGVLFASFLKILGPLMLCLPAIIALHMVPELGLEADPETGRIPQDKVYPAMVRLVLPKASLGLFAAVLVGAILSSFNSALNSAATLFSLGFYQRYINKGAPASQIVKVGKVFGTILAVSSIIIAPMLEELQSIYEYLQKVNGLYSVPIISIFFMGIVSSRTSALAAKIGMVSGLIAYTFFNFAGVEGLHWLHGYAISFGLSIGTMMVVNLWRPRTSAEIAASRDLPPAPVDMTPWRYAKAASWVIVVLLVTTMVPGSTQK